MTPIYIQFVTPAELAGIEGLSYLGLGQPARAATTFRAITDNPDPSYLRNHVYYTVQLAEATRQQGDIHQAATIALHAVPAVTAMSSARTGRLFAKLHTDLLTQAPSDRTVRDFADSYDSAVAR